jgi:hypothetical protein
MTGPWCAYPRSRAGRGRYWYEHVNLTGDYQWRNTAKLGKSKFRPLRQRPALRHPKDGRGGTEERTARGRGGVPTPNVKNRTLAN